MQTAFLFALTARIMAMRERKAFVCTHKDHEGKLGRRIFLLPNEQVDPAPKCPDHPGRAMERQVNRPYHKDSKKYRAR